MHINKKWLVWLGLILPVFVWAGTTNLTHVRISSAQSTARIDFFLTHPVKYHAFRLSNPPRLVMDFPDTKLRTDLKNIKQHYSLIKTIRTGHPDPSTLRLVIDLKSNVGFKIQSPTKKIMLDMYALSDSPYETVTSTDEQPMIVVIDPGHGGKDPGAVGVFGTKEKTVVLAIAKRLAQLINQQPHMRAVLTRRGDYFVPLAGRLRLARKGKADLFISIHADSYFNDRSSGASVFALSRHGATSLAARWLADRENHSELDGVNLRDLEDKSPMLRSVLIDLAQTATITDSMRLGTVVLDALDEVTALHYVRVEQAPFMVLKSPDIPSILVETGFLSNANEEKKLREEQYQHKIAQALLKGIQTYLRKYSTL